MERRNNKTEKEQQKRENLLQQLVDDFSTQKQHLLMQMKKGQLTKELFLSEAAAHIQTYFRPVSYTHLTLPTTRRV